MGTQKRYADSVDRRMLEKMYLREMVGQPDTLSEYEVDLRNLPLTTDPKPKKARAWVRYGGTAVIANVYVLAWTDRAVRVRWKQPDGIVQEAWVWAPAVRQLERVDADML